MSACTLLAAVITAAGSTITTQDMTVKGTTSRAMTGKPDGAFSNQPMAGACFVLQRGIA